MLFETTRQKLQEQWLHFQYPGLRRNLPQHKQTARKPTAQAVTLNELHVEQAAGTVKCIQSSPRALTESELFEMHTAIQTAGNTPFTLISHLTTARILNRPQDMEVILSDDLIMQHRHIIFLHYTSASAYALYLFAIRSKTIKIIVIHPTVFQTRQPTKILSTILSAALAYHGLSYTIPDLTATHSIPMHPATLQWSQIQLILQQLTQVFSASECVND